MAEEPLKGHNEETAFSEGRGDVEVGNSATPELPFEDPLRVVTTERSPSFIEIDPSGTEHVWTNVASHPRARTKSLNSQ